MKKLAMLTVAVAVIATPALAQDKNLRIVVPQEPPELDICNIATSAVGRVLYGNVGEGLTRRNPVTQEAEPMLATSWEQTSPTTWNFTLREGVTFHDGSPFNAENAVISFARTFDPDLSCGNANVAFGSLRATAEAIEPYVLEITTTAPDAILPLRISFIGLTGPDTDLMMRTNNPVGTGPYRFRDWQRGGNLTLEAFDNYWGDAGEADTVTYIFRSEDLVRAEMVSTGEADIAVALPSQFADMENTIIFAVPETTGLRMHMQSPPFDDLRVRQAVNYAIDREGLVEAVWNGMAKPAGQPITEDVLGFDPDIEAAPYDPDRARALVDEARADGVVVDTLSKIYTRLDILDNGDLLSQALAQQLNDIGLNVQVEVQEAAPWIDVLRIHPGDMPGFLLEPHYNPLGDASLTMNSKYHSTIGRSQNRGETADIADQMIDEAGAAAMGEERERLFQEAIRYIDDLVTDAFIAHTDALMSVGPNVKYQPNVMSNASVVVTEVTFND